MNRKNDQEINDVFIVFALPRADRCEAEQIEHASASFFCLKDRRTNSMPAEYARDLVRFRAPPVALDIRLRLC
jgi:hypothetical protein